MNVSACDKSSGKSKSITITNEKGRLTKEQVDRMVEEAEKFAEDDKKQRELIEAKNSVESYVVNWRNKLTEETTKTKLSEDEVKSATELVEATQSWLDEHPSESKETYSEKQKELETFFNPLSMKLYAGGSDGSNGSSGMPPMGANGMPDFSKMDPKMMEQMMQMMGGMGGGAQSESSEPSEPSGPVVDEVD